MARAPFPALLAAALLAPPALAQLEYGGAPLPPELVAGLDVPSVVLPEVDHAALLQEDLTLPKGPLRFGVVQEVSLGLSDAGAWHALPDGGRVWLLRVQSPGAFSLGLVFAEFSLAPGGELFVYDDGRATVRGAYTWQNNLPSGEFAVQPMQGDVLTLEYHEPAADRPQGRIRLGGVVHDYRNFFALVDDPGPARGGSCNVDVNCSQGNPWRNQIDSAVQTISNGVLCSASLVNNTANDGRQLVISANHCGTLNNGVFRFNFQRSGCGTGTSPTNMTVQGSTLLATSTNGDFRLVEIIPAIPSTYHAYYSGWNRANTPTPTSVFCVHHPSGCPKKISFENQAPTRTGIYWRIQDWDVGTTEGGSSGAPLYDQNGRFIGQLCCGLAACGNNLYDEFGALNTYWGMVSGVLDPLGTGATAIDGFDPSCPTGAAGATSRNGSGVNPALYAALTTPVIGTNWVTSVDIVSQGAATSLVTVGSAATQGTILMGTLRGELLCLPPYLPTDVATGVHSLAIPFDCTLVGRTFHTQAATYKPGAIQLTNALDALVGSM